MPEQPIPATMLADIRNIIKDARSRVQRAVNTTMVFAYWQIGRLIVEHEQQGRRRAAYGTRLLKGLSQTLTEEFGKGFDISNLRNMRRFYQAFPIQDAVRPELSWTHYRKLISIDSPAARSWYMQEAIDQNWSARALERQIGTFYYERLLSSKNRAPVEAEANTRTTPLRDDPRDYLRDPYILDFLNLDDRPYQESDLETGIISNLQRFLLELGKLTHQDVGQMDTYIRIYDQHKKSRDDNPTVGLILCSQKGEAVAKYSVLTDSQQIFAAKYLPYLPTEDELKRELERERRMVESRIEEARGLYRVVAGGRG